MYPGAPHLRQAWGWPKLPWLGSGGSKGISTAWSTPLLWASTGSAATKKPVSREVTMAFTRILQAQIISTPISSKVGRKADPVSLLKTFNEQRTQSKNRKKRLKKQSRQTGNDIIAIVCFYGSDYFQFNCLPHVSPVIRATSATSKGNPKPSWFGALSGPCTQWQHGFLYQLVMNCFLCVCDDKAPWPCRRQQRQQRHLGGVTIVDSLLPLGYTTFNPEWNMNFDTAASSILTEYVTFNLYIYISPNRFTCGVLF